MLLAAVWHSGVDARRPKKTLKPDAIAINCDIPDDFGKTHFIVGCPEDQQAKFKAQKKAPITEQVKEQPFDLFCDGCIKRVLFSPDDQIQKILLHLIGVEKESIRLTAYSFTDGQVAQALMDAHDRGVNVQIIADPGCMLDRFGKIPLLKEHEIMVFVYNPDHLSKDKKTLVSSIMHNKFIIFGKNISGKSIIWTGSFNWTKAAHKRNQENVVILDDKHCVDKYLQQFEILKARCNGVKPKKEIVVRRPRMIESPIILSKKGTVFEHNEVKI